MSASPGDLFNLDDPTEEEESAADRFWKRITDQRPDPSSPRQMKAADRLHNYENRTAWAMVILALLYLVLYSFYVLDTALTAPDRSLLNTGMNVIWVIFIFDLSIRTLLAPRHVAYLVHHPIDVLAVAVPAFRVLRVLRVLTAGQWLISRGSRLRVGRTATAVVIAVLFLAYISSLAVLNAERGAKGASIETFGDSLWWSMVTMATVGYGDYVPVTTNGRIIAVGVMVVGISLLGLVGASVASAVISRLSGKTQQGQDEVKADVTELRAEIAALRDALAQAGFHAPTPSERAAPANPTTPSPPADQSSAQHGQSHPDPGGS